MATTIKAPARIVFLAVLPLLLAGCAGTTLPQAAVPGPIHPVSGRVLEGDKPLAGVAVVFHPHDARPGLVKPQATTAADGTFRLTTNVSGDGAPPGEYAVTLVWAETAPGPDKDDAVVVRDRFNGKYANPATPFCRVTVTAGDNALQPFRVKK